MLLLQLGQRLINLDLVTDVTLQYREGVTEFNFADGLSMLIVADSAKDNYDFEDYPGELAVLNDNDYAMLIYFLSDSAINLSDMYNEDEELVGADEDEEEPAEEEAEAPTKEEEALDAPAVEEEPAEEEDEKEEKKGK